MQTVKGKARRLVHRLLYGKPYRPPEPDDFIRRLPSSVIGEGMLHPGNIRLMEQAVRDMPEGGCVLEIGSHGGLSANLLTYLLDKHGREAPLFCCDAWAYEGYQYHKKQPAPSVDGRGDVLWTDYAVYMKEAFVRAAHLLSAHRLPRAFHLLSDDFFDAWQRGATLTDVFGRQTALGGPVAFAYIDGNHTYEYAKRDFDNTAAALLPGGYVLLDDSADYLPFGCVRLAHELCRRRDFEVADINPNYLFRKK
jgi:hypothetical protein